MKSNATRHSPRQQRWLLLASLATLSIGAAAADAPLAAMPALRSLTVAAASASQTQSLDGVVEALRQTVVAAQVAGAIVQLEVKAGDRVKAGQVLMRIDARAAEQAANASEAQAQAARAALQLASREFERQQALHKQHYISQAALDQAEAQYKATQAQVNAQLAQLAVARTQSAFNTVRSPYDGVVAELPVSLGDMAMPGRALVTVYDPSALRVSANVPQSVAAGLNAGAAPALEIPGLAAGMLAPTRVQLLPIVDAASHTLQLRLDLPPRLSGAVPGMFARVWLPGAAAAGAASPMVPRTAVVKRAELTGLYVLDGQGKPLLRQVRLGAVRGDQVEVLSGLSAGEKIALDPQAAARIR
ncbi:efflux RND transporter periplasmic adaptor subunit [Paucibacter soli]|uniref:efflux RND transporter periplasmic adaptor subunit n=1 Tax=Paucibacter soli TaxID=3133433 RepID=UPI0030B7BC48